MITVVTTTHCRPKLFTLLERWVKAQIVYPDQWLVINDSPPEIEEQYKYTCNQDVFRRKPGENERHSLCENWLAALRFDRIKGSRIIIMEDDDYYSPHYIQSLVPLFKNNALVGLQNDYYWNVQQQSFRNLRNVSMASLATTGFRQDATCFVRKIAGKGDPYIDGLLWDEWTGTKAFVDNLGPDGKALHVGIKGAVPASDPGSGVSTSSHYENMGGVDWGCNKLKEWVPFNVAQLYMEMKQA